MNKINARLSRVKYCLNHLPLYIKQFTNRCCKHSHGHLNRFTCSSLLRYSKKFNYENILIKMKKIQIKHLSYFGYLSNIILVIAIGLGLYARWLHSQDLAIILIASLGLFVLAIASAMVYYFSMEAVGFSLARLWVGCLLGVISFPDDTWSHYHDPVLESTASSILEGMEILLGLSVVIHGVWCVVSRLAHLVQSDCPNLINHMDTLEMSGFAISTLITGRDSVSISLLVFALIINIAGIRSRSYIALFQLLVFLLISSLVIFPKLLQTTVNPYSISCLLGRVTFESIIDMYFCGKTTIERWEPVLRKSVWTHYLLILVVFAFEVTFFIFLARQMPRHKEWYVVVPIFSGFAFVWICYHIVFLITCVQLAKKIRSCNVTYDSLSEDVRSMHRVMAAKGVRHFGLISQRILIVALALTLILAVIGWETKSAVSMALLLIVVPAELCVLSFLLELGHLGGTCVGYAVVAPTDYNSGLSSDTIQLLPPGAMQELGSRATRLLNSVQAFLSFHLIDTYGCDYTSSGLTVDAFHSKLGSFFQRVTPDQLRFDTYLMYYCGPSYCNGDLALAGGERLTLETLLEWWEASCTDASDSRLILVLDTQYSHKWCVRVRRIKPAVVGLQTCEYLQPLDEEEGAAVKIGDFTRNWVNHTMSSGNLWKGRESRVRAHYGVSRTWTDFTFHLPTEQDIIDHWDSSYPRATKPLIRITNFPMCGDLCCCCQCVVKCIRRKKMRWLPPVECDTGHGFKLLRL